MGDSVYSHYIVQLQQNGLLKGDDVTDRFFFSLTVIPLLLFYISTDPYDSGVLML